EFRDRRRVLSLHRHVNQDLEAEADRGGIDDGSVSADRPGLFQRAHAPVARSDAELDPVSERGHRQAAFLLKLSNDFSVNSVHVENSCSLEALRARICKKSLPASTYLFDNERPGRMKAGEGLWVTSSTTHRSPPRRSRSPNSCPSSSRCCARATPPASRGRGRRSPA